MKKIQCSFSSVKMDGETVTKLSLQGDLTIQNLEEVKNQVVEAVKHCERMEVVVRNVEGLDLACIQLFFSMRETFARSNRKINFDIDLPDEIKSIVEHAGFIDLPKMLEVS